MIERAYNPAIKQWDRIKERTDVQITFYTGNTIDATDVIIVFE